MSVRFIILSAARSGTQLLQSLLQSHPRARCCGEVLYENYDYGDLAPPGTPPSTFDRSAWDCERQADLAGFLERRIWNSGDPSLKAMGFRVFPDQLQARDGLPLSILSRDAGLKVISLRRDNHLARYISIRQALASGLWREQRPSRSPPEPLYIEEAAFRAFTTGAIRDFDAVLSAFAPDQIHHLSYDTLAAGWQTEMPRVFAFLGLPSHPVSPGTHSQARYPARSLVLNRDALAESLRGTHEGRWLQGDSTPAPAPPSARISRGIPLFSHIGGDDADLVPAFLAHYRALGVTDFHIVLHGAAADRARLRALLGSSDVTIETEYEGIFSEQTKCDQLTRLLPAHRGRWAVVADADEFLELPYRSLTVTVRALAVLRLRSMMATMVQRLAGDGSLPALEPGQDPQSVYPLASVLLAERMNPAVEPWRNKVPLFLVQDDSAIAIGHHISPTPDVAHSVPLRGVVHHFKWRQAMVKAMPQRRQLTDANGWEVEGYARYLQANGEWLPLDGSFLPLRDELRRRGLLQRPDRAALALYALLGRLRSARLGGEDPTSLPALSRRVWRLEPALRHRWPPAGELALSPEAWALLRRRQRIGVITFQLSFADTTAGIGTAVGAMTEALALAGHEVTIIHAAMGQGSLPESVQRVWNSQALRVVSYQLQSAGGFTTPRLPLEAVQWIAQQDFDLLHLHDCLGLGAGLAAARQTATMFWRTPMVVTAHGGTLWHRDANALPLDAQHLHIDHAERLQIRLADATIAPSGWMHRWMLNNAYQLPAKQAVHPNLLTASTRLVPRPPEPAHRPVRELVFFGRLERRKGLETFCRAISLLAERGLRPASVTFLGRPDYEGNVAQLLDTRHAWPFPSRVLESYGSQTALRYLMEAPALAVIPSHWDNLPYTVYECLANGVAMIAAPVGGIPELLHPDDHARVLVENTPEALADAMGRALNEGFLPGRLSLSPDLVMLQWLAWQDALAGGTTPSVRDHLPHDWFWWESKARMLDVVLLDEEADSQSVAHTLLALDQQVGQAFTLHLRGACLEETRFADPAWPRAHPDAALRSVTRLDWQGPLNTAALANRLAAQGTAKGVVFVMSGTLLDVRALRVLNDALLAGDTDAVIAAHEIVVAADGTDETPWRRAAERQPMGGPTILASGEDLHGLQCFAIRRETLERLGGFAPTRGLGRFAALELLNRLVATGGQVLPLPIELYTQILPRARAESLMPDPPQRALLAAALTPFLDSTAGQLLRLIAHRLPLRPEAVIQVEQHQQGLSPNQDVTQLMTSASRLGGITSKRALKRIRAAGHARTQLQGSSLRIVSSGIDPILLLRGLRLASQPCRLIVQVDIELEQSATLQLFWQTSEARSFAEMRSQRRIAQRGRQVITFVTPLITPHGWLRLDPLASSGVAMLQGIEVHAARI